MLLNRRAHVCVCARSCVQSNVSARTHAAVEIHFVNEHFTILFDLSFSFSFSFYLSVAGNGRHFLCESHNHTCNMNRTGGCPQPPTHRKETAEIAFAQ